jgi:hypothetical protein
MAKNNSRRDVPEGSMFALRAESVTIYPSVRHKANTLNNKSIERLQFNEIGSMPRR